MLVVGLGSIPLMVAVFGAGLVAGTINFASSAIFCIWLKVRRDKILGYAKMQEVRADEQAA